jgi:prepilin-type N-terminal cleavage/methylation domain-containing protein
MKKRHNRGFTLLETMLVVTLAAIILGLGVPSYRQFTLNNRMTGAANDLLAATHLARTEAIKRHAPVIMCLVSNPDAAAPACNGDGSQGWVVFADASTPPAPTTDNNGLVDGTEPVLVRHGPISDAITVRSFPDPNGNYVAYSAAGFRRNNVGALGISTNAFVLCDDRGNTAVYGPAQSAARAFLIGATGRPSITRSVTDITAAGGC